MVEILERTYTIPGSTGCGMYTRSASALGEDLPLSSGISVTGKIVENITNSSVRLGSGGLNWFLIKTVLYEAPYKILRASQYERKKEENHSI